MALGPLVSYVFFGEHSFARTSFSFVGSSGYFFGPTFSSVCLQVTVPGSKMLLGETLESFEMSYVMSDVSSALTPIWTSVQQAPTTARLSRVVFVVPVLPMTTAYVPPRGSVSSPG